MAADVALLFDTAALRGDLAVANGRLVEEDGLATAVLISLFTDRRADPDDRLPDDAEGLRGWWGDLVDVIEGGNVDRIGSKLWLLSREKEQVEVLRRAEAYAGEALAWLLEDGVARSVDVVATAPLPGVLQLDVSIAQPSPLPALRYGYIWQDDRWRMLSFTERLQ
jgi:phage gp46-like protein